MSKFELIEECWLSGQIEPDDMNAMLADDVELRAWFMSRAAARMEMANGV